MAAHDRRLMAVAIPIDVVRRVICDIRSMGHEAPLSFKQLWVYLDPQHVKDEDFEAREEGNEEGPSDADLREISDVYRPFDATGRSTLGCQLTLFDAGE